MNAWDGLRKDWKVLTEVLRESGDREGFVLIFPRDAVDGELRFVRLDDPDALAQDLKNFASRTPDPLEVVIYALKDNRTALRSRQRAP